MRHFKIVLAGLIGVIALGVAPLFAAEGDLMSKSLEDLLNTPVTIATGTARSYASTPAAVYVITADDIAHSGYTNIWDVLRKVPGLNVVQESGNTVAIAIRGFNSRFSNRIQVLMDGRSVFNPITQGVYWSDQPIMLEDIERIEVMRGPNSVLYGFNAFDGVINIISKPASKTKGVATETTIGTRHNQEYYGRFGDSIGKWDYRFSYQKDNSEGLGGREGRQFQDGKRLQAYNLVTSGPLFSAGTLTLNAGGKGGLQGSESVKASADQNLYTDFQKIAYEQKFENGSVWKLNSSRTMWDINRQNTVTQHDLRYSQLDLNSDYAFKLGDKNDLLVGGGVRRNNGRSSSDIDPNKDYHDLIRSALVQETWSVTDKLTMHSGVSWEINNFTGTAWSYREMAMYEVVKGHFLRAGVSRAFHSHGFMEYYSNYATTFARGNPNLLAEQVTSYEAGYRGVFMDNKLTFDLDAFFSHIDRVRNFTTTGDYLNQNEAHSQGIESSLVYKPVSWLDTYANYSFLFIKDKLDQYDLQDPRNKFNVGSTLYLKGRLLPSYIDTRFYYVGVSDNYPFSGELAPSLVKHKASGYGRTDVKIAKNILNGKGEVAVTGTNLTSGEHYETGYGKQAIEKVYYLSFKLKF
ncbi:MAG: TonB-dependent receptor plug domain-containing protein [Candidatus Omnitrophica bacterium]|nr:TonB-dependent receptor plug domain-containing protein [Candidatus Omnitrophota bacterium]